MSKYAERDHEALEPEYLEHLSAMTGEGLRSKSAIAAELAWRDRQISQERREWRQVTDQLMTVINMYIRAGCGNGTHFVNQQAALSAGLEAKEKYEAMIKEKPLARE